MSWGKKLSAACLAVVGLMVYDIVMARRILQVYDAMIIHSFGPLAEEISILEKRENIVYNYGAVHDGNTRPVTYSISRFSTANICTDRTIAHQSTFCEISRVEQFSSNYGGEEPLVFFTAGVPAKRGPPVEVECHFCHALFKVQKTRARAAKYCSREHFYASGNHRKI